MSNAALLALDKFTRGQELPVSGRRADKLAGLKKRRLVSKTSWECTMFGSHPRLWEAQGETKAATKKPRRWAKNLLGKKAKLTKKTTTKQKTQRAKKVKPPPGPYLGPDFGNPKQKNPCFDWQGLPSPPEFTNMDFSERFVHEMLDMLSAGQLNRFLWNIADSCGAGGGAADTKGAKSRADVSDSSGDLGEDSLGEDSLGLYDGCNATTEALPANNGHEEVVLRLRLGTICSGSELLCTLLPHIEEEFYQRSGTRLEFVHVWACEWDRDKCAWIASNFPNVTKIFLDARDLGNPDGCLEFFSGERQFLDPIDLLCAGTSCKDASRMSSLQSQCRDVISKGTRSSGSTFVGFLAAVDITEPDVALLENVAGLKDKIKVKSGEPKPRFESNHDAVKYELNVRGYAFTSKVYDSRSCAIPHRRHRLYMGGVKTKFKDIVLIEQEEIGLDTRVGFCLGCTLNAVKVPTSLPSFLLDDADQQAFIRDWFPELVGKEPKDDVRKKWYDLHQRFWSQTDNARVKAAGHLLLDNKFWNSMPARQKDLLLYLYSMDDPTLNAGSGEMRVWDLSQNMGRVPTSTGSIPCALPRASPWLRDLHRPLCGAESLFLQGADPRRLPALRRGVWTSGFLQDLAGNAFTVPAFAAWLIAIYAAK